MHEEESSIHGGNDDLLEPLFSVISDVQAAEEAEENIDSLITGKTRQ